MSHTVISVSILAILLLQFLPARYGVRKNVFNQQVTTSTDLVGNAPDSFRANRRRVMFPQSTIVAKQPLPNAGQINVVLVPVDFSDLTGNPHPDGDDGLRRLYATTGAFSSYVRNNSHNDNVFVVSLAPSIRASVTAASVAASGDITPVFNSIYSNLSSAQDMSFAQLYILCTKAIGGAYQTTPFWSDYGYGIWVNGTYGTPAYPELAKMFGLRKADAFDTTTRTIISFGNKLDGAGAPFGYLNPVFSVRAKVGVGWLEDEMHVITTYRKSGTYRIYAHDKIPSHGHRALRLGFPGPDQYFYLEYRSFGGAGNSGTRLYPSELSTDLTSPLVQGASLLWTYRSSTSTVLLNTSTVNPVQNAYSTTIPVGSTYNVHVNFDSSKPVYVTVNVAAAGGSNDLSYLDINVTFPNTPYCAFSASGTDLCPIDIHEYVYGSQETSGTMPSQRLANIFSVHPHVQLTGLRTFWVNSVGNCVNSVTVYIHENGSDSKPGVVWAQDTYTLTGGRVLITTASSLYNLGSKILNPGSYWLSFAYVANDSSCSLYMEIGPGKGDSTYTQGVNGSWFITDKRVNFGFTFDSVFIDLPVTQLVALRTYPKSPIMGNPLDLTIQYRNSLGFPAFPKSPGHIKISMSRSDGSSVTFQGATDYDTPVYSSTLTMPNIVVNELGLVRITYTDNTFGLSSDGSSQSSISTPTNTATLASSIAYIGATVNPSIRVLQSLPVPIAFELRKSDGSRDTTSQGETLIALGTSGTLSSVGVPIVNGLAQYTNLNYAQCPDGATGYITFQLLSKSTVSTVVSMLVDRTALSGNAWALRFGKASDSSIVNGLQNPSIGVVADQNNMNVVVEAAGACAVNTSIQNVIITLTAVEPSVQLTNNIATMSNGVATFPNLTVTFTDPTKTTQLTATATWGTGGSGTLPNPISSDMKISHVQEFSSVAIKLPSSSFVLVQNQPVMPPIIVESRRSDNSLDTNFTGAVSISIPDIELQNNSANAVGGVARFDGLMMTSCALTRTMDITATATVGTTTRTQTVTVDARSQEGYDVALSAMPRNIYQNRSFSVAATVVDPCGIRDRTANDLIVVASISDGNVTGNTATVVSGAAVFPSMMISNVTVAAPILSFAIASADPSQVNAVTPGGGRELKVSITTQGGTTPRGPASSELLKVRSDEYNVRRENVDPLEFNLSEYVSAVTNALFGVPKHSDVEVEVTAQLWGAPTYIRHRCIFAANATVPVTLPATDVAEEKATLDAKDPPTLNKKLWELHQRVFWTANNPLKNYGVPAHGVTRETPCPSDSCSRWGIPQRAPSLQPDTCRCICVNFWGSDKCDKCQVQHLDAQCLDCEFSGGTAPDCPATGDAPGLYSPKTMSRSVMIAVSVVIATTAIGGALLYFLKPAEIIPTI